MSELHSTNPNPREHPSVAQLAEVLGNTLALLTALEDGDMELIQEAMRMGGISEPQKNTACPHAGFMIGMSMVARELAQTAGFETPMDAIRNAADRIAMKLRAFGGEV